MYLVTTTVVCVDDLTLEEAIEAAREGREQGKATELISREEAKKRGYFPVVQMQDLTLINSWGDIK